ncbi:MAG: MBL fold metallo-hydrolase [Cetobacterium sp.]|nr:MBL fold metallo-hydrolase [Cetobacterium sp.]
MKKFINVTPNVKWVGVVDQDARKFHGEELSVNHGSSYNSYLIREDKIVLIDGVKATFSREWIEKLKEEIDLNKIDYLILNHCEPDHSGSIPDLVDEIPNVPIYCTQKAREILEAYYGKRDWNFNIVKSGDNLSIGNKNLVFLEMKMLHWPDSMLTYLLEDQILFSNDAFGEHYGANELFDDMVEEDILKYECLKYYACILSPFSKLIKLKLQEIEKMGLKFKIICPSHGVIWRKNPNGIVEKYRKWCEGYSENQILIVYDTMWNTTRKMAEVIADGIREIKPDWTIKLLNSGKTDLNDVVTEIFKSKGILMGSSTINSSVLPSMGALLSSIKTIPYENKKVNFFGSYGWNGRAMDVFQKELEKSPLIISGECLKIKWNLDEDTYIKAWEFGMNFASQL